MDASGTELLWAGVGLAVTLAVVAALAIWTAQEEGERHARTPPPTPPARPAEPPGPV